MKTRKKIVGNQIVFQKDQRVYLRKVAPNHSEEREGINQALRETRAKIGGGPFYVIVALDTFANEINNVGHPQQLLISKTKRGPMLKNDQGKPQKFSGILFKKTK